MGSNRFLDRLKNQHPTEHGTKAERKLAKRQGARLMPASGAMAGAKSDMLLGHLRIESKATQADSLSLKLGWLRKIAHEADELGQTPALVVQFVNPDGNPRAQGAWVLLRETDFEALKEKL